MGISMSWIAVKGRSREAVLNSLDMDDTGEAVVDRRTKFVCAQAPSGWLIVRVNDFEFASAKRTAAASVGGLAIGCAVEDHVMVSSLRYYENGAAAWSVAHNPARGVYDLTVRGNPPPALAEIRKRTVAEQKREGGAKAEVDLIFDIPTELATAVCGFDPEEPDDLDFTVLKPNPRYRRHSSESDSESLMFKFGRLVRSWQKK